MSLIWYRLPTKSGSMPVTAKLSRKFYDTLGDDVANDLVPWFNSVDLTYRTDLRELNELNHGRFMVKRDREPSIGAQG